MLRKLSCGAALLVLALPVLAQNGGGGPSGQPPQRHHHHRWQGQNSAANQGGGGSAPSQPPPSANAGGSSVYNRGGSTGPTNAGAPVGASAVSVGSGNSAPGITVVSNGQGASNGSSGYGGTTGLSGTTGFSGASGLSGSSAGAASGGSSGGSPDASSADPGPAPDVDMAPDADEIQFEKELAAEGIEDDAPAAEEPAPASPAKSKAQSKASAISRVVDACHNERGIFCDEVKSDDAKTAKCLLEHYDDVLDKCRDALDGAHGALVSR